MIASTFEFPIMMTAWIYVCVVVTNILNVMVVSNVMSNSHPGPVPLQANNVFNISCVVISCAWIYCLSKISSLKKSIANSSEMHFYRLGCQLRNWSIGGTVCSGFMSFMHLCATIWIFVSVSSQSDISVFDKIHCLLTICLNLISLLIVGTWCYLHVNVAMMYIEVPAPPKMIVKNHIHNSVNNHSGTVVLKKTTTTADPPKAPTSPDANFKFEEEYKRLQDQLNNLMKKRDEELKKRRSQDDERNEEVVVEKPKKRKVYVDQDGDIVSDSPKEIPVPEFIPHPNYPGINMVVYRGINQDKDIRHLAGNNDDSDMKNLDDMGLADNNQ